MDRKPKTDAEKWAQQGLHKEKMRPGRDMRFLCMHVEKKALEAGLNTAESGVWIMFGACLKLQEQMSIQEILERVN